MQITRVDVTISEAPVRHQCRWRAGLPGSGTTNVPARRPIDTDEGVTGIAYASRGSIGADLPLLALDAPRIVVCNAIPGRWRGDD